MKTEAVVFFYLQKKQSARIYPWQKCNFDIQEVTWLGRRLFLAGIPEYDWGVKPWRTEKLKRKLSESFYKQQQKLITENTFFLCERSLLKNTIIRQAVAGSFPLEVEEDLEGGEMGDGEGIRMLVEDLREDFLKEFCTYDSLMFIDGAEKSTETLRMEFDAVEFLRAHADNINYLMIVTEREAQYEEICEEIYAEHGLACVVVNDLKSWSSTVGNRLLVVDASPKNKKFWRTLPCGCIYFDLWSKEETERALTVRRKDVRYLSFYRQVEKKFRSTKSAKSPATFCACNLDTMRQNRYNT